MMNPELAERLFSSSSPNSSPTPRGRVGIMCVFVCVCTILRYSPSSSPAHLVLPRCSTTQQAEAPGDVHDVSLTTALKTIWVCCVALPCCLFDLACFFLPSFSSLIKTCIHDCVCLSQSSPTCSGELWRCIRASFDL